MNLDEMEEEITDGSRVEHQRVALVLEEVVADVGRVHRVILGQRSLAIPEHGNANQTLR